MPLRQQAVLDSILGSGDTWRQSKQTSEVWLPLSLTPVWGDPAMHPHSLLTFKPVHMHLASPSGFGWLLRVFQRDKASILSPSPTGLIQTHSYEERGSGGVPTGTPPAPSDPQGGLTAPHCVRIKFDAMPDRNTHLTESPLPVCRPAPCETLGAGPRLTPAGFRLYTVWHNTHTRR